MRYVLPLLPVLALAGCYAPPPPYNVPPDSPVNVAYRCDDGQQPVVRYFSNDRATIRLAPDRAVDLTMQPGGGGTGGDRFAGDGIAWTTKGGEGTLEVDGKRTACKRMRTD